MVAFAACVLATACTGSARDPGANAGNASGDGPASTSAPSASVPSRVKATPAAPPPVRTSIVVPSTTAQYFVLWVRPSLDDPREVAASITLGRPGNTTLTDGRTRLPDAHYRVEAHEVAAPADVDGDGIDDLTELRNPTTMNPCNPAGDIAPSEGSVIIADRAQFEALSYRGTEVTAGSHLADLEFVKFYVLGLDTDHPRVWFMNTETYRSHRFFANAMGIPNNGGPQPGEMRGELVYHRNVVAPDGTLGVYRFEFEALDSYAFADVRFAYELLASNMPVLTNNLLYYPMPVAALPRYLREKSLYDASRVRVLLESDVQDDTDFVALNRAEGLGLLRVMTLEQQPNPRDVVIYRALPNDLPRVAGVITTVPQTPLSHVNLRAVQDGVPNAFVRDALDDHTISSLVGRYVRYTVTATGFRIVAATAAEVDAHHAAARPATAQTPVRDLSVRSIRPLAELRFEDWRAFGVKAANLATLGTFGLPAGTVPDGFAVPFAFYDEFLKANGIDRRIRDMLAMPSFHDDAAVQDRMLAELRDAIRAAPMPDRLVAELAQVRRSFAADASIRCRSSTNNEDLPGFSGAGLYTSKTQHPDEGPLTKCVTQVYASLWSTRAFSEREYFRVDHERTAMGVVLHEAFADEVANGVAVSTDPLHDGTDGYYVNVQLGEDLVTNPDALSIPEELILHGDGGVDVIRRSNLVAVDRSLLTDGQRALLHLELTVIHRRFADLYGVPPGGRFAIEIEFKIASDGTLVVKQARPWVFA